MKIKVNGKERDVGDGTVLRDFILGAGVSPDGAIAELNGKVIRRDLWIDTALADGDCLELVSLVGGG